MSSVSNISDVAFEQHYKLPEIAKKMAIDYKTALKLFKDEPGVLVMHSDGTLKKRKYTSYRVPESVVVRVHRKWRQREDV